MSSRRRREGKLTYDDLNDILPLNATSEEIDDVMVTLNKMDVEIVDEFRMDAETQQQQQQQERLARRAEIRRDAAQAKLERADDPVRMYLREMGRVPLLTKDQEVAIAKRIEAAEMELTDVLLSTPYTLKEIQMLAARVMAGRLNFAQITEMDDARDQNRFVKRLPALMDELGDFDSKIEAQEKRLRRSGLAEKSVANAEKRIGELRSKQADLVREFRLKAREIMKIARKIKGLKRRIATARDEIDRIEREVEFHADEIHSMSMQVRRSANAAEKLGIEREVILDADRRLSVAQRKIDQIKADARLEPEEINELIATLKDREEKIYAAKIGACGSESSFGGEHRQEVHEPRDVVPGFDSGREHRPDEGGGQIRVSARVQIQHVCDVVDPAGDYAFDCRPGADDSYSRAYDRVDQ